VARGLLAAVGVRHDVSGRARRDTDDRQLAAMWLNAHGIRDLIAVGVEALSGDPLAELVELTTLAGAQLWLVADHILPDLVADELSAWPLGPCPPAQFHSRWLAAAPEVAGAAPTTSRGSVAATPMPAVPTVDFPVFLATARRSLPADEFAAVERRYIAERDAALAAIHTGTDPIEVLRSALERCPDEPTVTVTVRGVQAAAFRCCRHLRVDVTAVLGCGDFAPVAAADDPGTWRLLHAYRQPERQTACALTLASASLTDQRALTIADIDPDRPAVRIDGDWKPLPAGARPALHALLMARRAAAAADTDPLLARLDRSEVTTRALADVVNAVQRETGVRFTVGQLEREAVTTDSWARRRGITVSALEV
jgi:hypothetical protein